MDIDDDSGETNRTVDGKEKRDTKETRESVSRRVAVTDEKEEEMAEYATCRHGTRSRVCGVFAAW
jgi:hypothetical protein